MRRRLLDDAGPAADALLSEMLVPPDRVSIYRNTSRVALTNALRLNYPAVQRLVGEDFFAAAADTFIANVPPRMAWLDFYGIEFPEFLEGYGPAASLRYLPDTARLERAASRALHAADAERLAPAQLAKTAIADRARLSFVPHPTIGLVSSRYPVDAIWRAVLTDDDTALTAIDLNSGAVWLLIERDAGAVEVKRLDERRWRFAEALFAGRPLAAALEAADNVEAPVWLATHLTAGHFISFTVTEAERAPAILSHPQ
jgi:hypothetical protein